MRVWAILKRWEYEGDDLVSVCSKRRIAAEFCKKLRARDREIHMVGWRPNHKYVVVPFTLDLLA